MTYLCEVADVVAYAQQYKGEKFHALLCDPPYHLTSITERFGKEGSAPAKDKDGLFQRASRGFMGQTWDGGDVAFRPETWNALGELLYPGAFLMAYASSRGWHRLAVAIEDGGFLIHPSIFAWVQGQGFPKATRIDKRVDRMNGQEQEVIATGHSGKTRGVYNAALHPESFGGDYEVTQPITSLAKDWKGHRYGAQAMKPAVEPIILAQKPYDGRPLENIVTTGAGALNIDAARIHSDDDYVINRWQDGSKPFGGGAGHPYEGDTENARWPANFVLDETTAPMLDEQSPETSRFFFQVQSQIDEADPVMYASKVSKTEREAGLEDVEETISGFANAGGRTINPTCIHTGKRIQDCDCGNCEWDRENTPRPMRKNIHPTLKPIHLNTWLATLLLPPERYAPRRLFVPFSGAGSEMIGGLLAGWEYVLGVELSRNYTDIAYKRIAYWLSKDRQLPLF